MASADSRKLPAYFLKPWQSKHRHALLTPATRWRVFIEDQERIETDVILNAVLRIRQAGETDPSRIADLLQLPEELIRFLIASAGQLRLHAAESGQGIVAARSTVGWVYRDVATGELWPQPGEQSEPVEIDFWSGWRGQFETGTAGRVNRIDALLLDSDETSRVQPTSIELSRFGWSDDEQKRTAVISSGEPCLAVSPVVKDDTGLAVLTSQDSPQLSLGRLLNASVNQFSSVERWAKGVPLKTQRAESSPLELALAELTNTLDHFGIGQFRIASSEHLVGLIDLSLGRWVDQYRSASGPEATSERSESAPLRSVTERFGVSLNVIQRWERLPRFDSRRKVLELLVACTQTPDARLKDLSVVAAQYDLCVDEQRSSEELLQLAKQMVTVGQLLLEDERANGHGEVEG